MKLSKGVILLFLGLFIKVAAAENSTQVYWLELEIESSVYNYFTDLLSKQTLINIDQSSVTEIKITTDCKWNEMHKNCSCEEKYTFSEDMCKNYDCCHDTCWLNAYDIAVCLPEDRVSINGLTTFGDLHCTYLCDSSQIDSKEYQQDKDKIDQLLKKTYSALKYFDSLIINSYRSGSVIANYTVQVMGAVSLTDLDSISQNLSDSKLKTNGLIKIASDDKVNEIGSTIIITCTPPVQLANIEVKWFLTDRQNKTTELTTGKEAYLKKDNDKDVIELRDISGSWKGTIQCMYKKGSIEHTASTVLDIALLPEIQVTSTPQFPDCRDRNAQVNVDIECKILDDNENYNVTWNTTLSFTNKGSERDGNFIIYKITAKIICAKKDEMASAGCVFTNVRSKINSSRSQIVQMPIINNDSKFCDKDNNWPIAKNNYTAILPCADNSVGFTNRSCMDQIWGKEISSCVNADLHNVQKAVEELKKGIGFIKDDADTLFKQIQQTTTVKTFQSFANINASVTVFKTMNDVSKQQSNQWNDTIMNDFVSSLSNALNKTEPWKNPKDGNTNLSLNYLHTVEEIMGNSNLSMNNPYHYDNVKLEPCNKTDGAACGGFNANVTTKGVVVVAFQNLHEILPPFQKRPLNTTILSVTALDNVNKPKSVDMMFEFAKKRLKNYKMHCIYWDENNTEWSSEGCTWGGAQNQQLCTCEHNSAFTIMMSKEEETLPYENELTYAGLGISIVSLVLCLIIEFLVWDTVVKSDISNFRHVALVNISACLLLANCAFLASSDPKTIGNTRSQWCSILTVLKHFFFLAVFFWMLCLSLVLLHQMIFVFDQLRKKVFLVLSITVGYVCPLICVTATYIAFDNGKEGEYFSKDSCWLIYQDVMKGSLFSFIIPALTIVIVNLFTLVVVIMKIVSPTVSDSKARDQKDVARAMIKTIVFLSPVLGLTWLLGIFVLYLDLTQTPYAQIVSYAFTLLNSLQGFLILLTNCLGEKKVRDALLKRFQSKKLVQSKTESSTKATSSVMMK
ncbi:LOW QUALITY PROTEIN: adhesion G-protein coupled receptor F1 [Puntigrus tetrazona]|uniref:LOW QUALITY PROTEIN: adhesion G-protein coupled receptor F1 n=1 Tax=Puntigrus tetrazona TaxID=1606681 RepID=UPI001C8ACAA2|nr:LOW QUALITY PROTEIN: adhesion G-protein coupled receptor F1 [Puntigrus tetrazona]